MNNNCIAVIFPRLFLLKVTSKCSNVRFHIMLSQQIIACLLKSGLDEQVNSFAA